MKLGVGLFVVGDDDDVPDLVPGKHVLATFCQRSILGIPVAVPVLPHQTNALERVEADCPGLPEPVDIEHQKQKREFHWEPQEAPYKGANEEDRERARKNLQSAY